MAAVVKWGEPGQEVWVQILTLPVFLTFFNSVPGIQLTELRPACWLSCWAQKHPVFKASFTNHHAILIYFPAFGAMHVPWCPSRALGPMPWREG